MRAITYKLMNGETVYSYQQAKESGMKFTLSIGDVTPPASKVSPKRAEMLRKYGFVRKAL